MTKKSFIIYNDYLYNIITLNTDTIIGAILPACYFCPIGVSTIIINHHDIQFLHSSIYCAVPAPLRGNSFID